MKINAWHIFVINLNSYFNYSRLQSNYVANIANQRKLLICGPSSHLRPKTLTLCPHVDTVKFVCDKTGARVQCVVEAN